MQLIWYLVDFDDNISLILDLWHWSVLNDNLARSLEDYCFHCFADHVEELVGAQFPTRLQMCQISSMTQSKKKREQLTKWRQRALILAPVSSGRAHDASAGSLPRRGSIGRGRQAPPLEVERLQACIVIPELYCRDDGNNKSASLKTELVLRMQHMWMIEDLDSRAAAEWLRCTICRKHQRSHWTQSQTRKLPICAKAWGCSWCWISTYQSKSDQIPT
jgi:hypothetical protein